MVRVRHWEGILNILQDFLQGSDTELLDIFYRHAGVVGSLKIVEILLIEGGRSDCKVEGRKRRMLPESITICDERTPTHIRATGISALHDVPQDHLVVICDTVECSDVPLVRPHVMTRSPAIADN